MSKPKAKITKSLVYDPHDKRCDDCGYTAVWVARDSSDTLVSCKYSRADCEKEAKSRGYVIEEDTV